MGRQRERWMNWKTITHNDDGDIEVVMVMANTNKTKLTYRKWRSTLHKKKRTLWGVIML